MPIVSSYCDGLSPEYHPQFTHPNKPQVNYYHSPHHLNSPSNLLPLPPLPPPPSPPQFFSQRQLPLEGLQVLNDSQFTSSVSIDPNLLQPQVFPTTQIPCYSFQSYPSPHQDISQPKLIFTDNSHSQLPPLQFPSKCQSPKTNFPNPHEILSFHSTENDFHQDESILSIQSPTLPTDLIHSSPKTVQSTDTPQNILFEQDKPLTPPLTPQQQSSQQEEKSTIAILEKDPLHRSQLIFHEYDKGKFKSTPSLNARPIVKSRTKLQKKKSLLSQNCDTPQNTTKRKKRRIWFERDMKKAIRMVEQRGATGQRAAKECNVPVSSLWVRLQQRKMDREDEVANSCGSENEYGE
jgi:hypothetical protein